MIFDIGRSTTRPARLLALLAALACAPHTVLAAALPGPADSGRVRPEDHATAPNDSAKGKVVAPATGPSAEAPPGTEKIHLILKEVRIDGMSAFLPEAMADIYTPYLQKDVTLDVAWKIAAQITERYRSAGYFLSRAYVPQQRIDDGVITIGVVEGYVDTVDLDGPLKDQSVVRELIGRVTAQKPLTVDRLESFLLRLNDLPDASFRAILSPYAPNDHAPEGAVKLTLIPTKKSSQASLGFDNYGSRFLGPNEFTLNYSASLLPMQQTLFSGLSSMPGNELRYGTLEQRARLAAEWTVIFTGGITKAEPGYTLSVLDIRSSSETLGVDFQWQPIRQRQENLSAKIGFGGRDTSNDISGVPLTRDKIRTARASLNGDITDHWGGYNVANIELTQGIHGLGSSESGGPYISRAEAQPSFTKATLEMTRLQSVLNNWSVLGVVSGQLASGPLYSSEEFGYGGQAFGRAYDASEIVGDQGVNGSLELRYALSDSSDALRFTPYGFYDYGVVWNYDASQPIRQIGSSVGAGVRFDSDIDLSGNLGLAYPLRRDIATPIYGAGPQGPRAILQIVKEF